MSQSYYDKFAISNSSIKEWGTISPQEWYDLWISKTKRKKRKPAVALGSYVDCIIFTPKNVSKRFITVDAKKPSDNIVKICDDVYNSIQDFNDNAERLSKETPSPVIGLKKFDLEDSVLVKSICILNDYYKSTPDRAYSEVLKNGKTYFELLVKAAGRTIITEAEKKIAEELKEILCTHKISKGFFRPKKGCEVIFQLQLFSEFPLPNFSTLEFLPMKGMVDILHINHTLKQIREVDLKLTDDAFLFNDYMAGPVRRFDYPNQHSVYDYLIHAWKETYENGKYNGYAVMNPLNVVIDTTAKLPYLYEYDHTDLYIKRHGIENTRIKGWEDVIRDIAYHFDVNDWSMPTEHLRNGKILIKLFNK